MMDSNMSDDNKFDPNAISNPTIPSNTPDMIEDASSLISVDTDSVAFSNLGPPLKEEPEKIAEKETIAVSRIKQVVFTVLMISAIGFAFAVFFWTRQAELQNFEDAFYENSDKVLEGVGTSLLTTLGAIDALLVNIVSFAKYSNSSWPLVTVPDHAVRAAKVRSLSKAVLVSQYHFVTNDERSVWEDYSVANDRWVEQGIKVQQNDETYQGKIITDYDIRGNIHDETFASSALPGPYLPLWQHAPIVPINAPYNYDGYSSPGLAMAMQALMSEKVVISKVNNLIDPSDPSSEEQVKKSNEFIKNYLGENVDETEPFSDIFYPILGNAADSVSVPEGSDDSLFRGVFSLTFFWRDLLTDTLPNGSVGLVVVIGNECDQTFTYELNGPDVQYLGPGDRHEGDYDNVDNNHSAILELGALGNSGRYYTGLHQDNVTCPYFLSVYPSQDMKASYTTTDPFLYAITAVLIFIFTGVYFYIYDSMLTHRQKEVMKSAMRSNAIVSSLFPSNVRDRLFHQENEKFSKTGELFQPTKSRLKTYLNEDASKTINANSSRPIADLFPETTVMFADISGFTAWSSVREPAQVFTLLETLYGAFDAIAVRRGVFKVETIGDSYVAVTGLPEPRDDHAIVMAKFARDCRSQMALLTRQLEKTLGPGTGDLQLRFGLHSGPVTAGVLRGQKSRFQLFGDTVNTAARMESTGTRSRIQVSETTAALIKAAGKAHWVKPRNELVMAKGKGKMQTYWIEPRAGGHDRSNSLSHGSFCEISATTSLSNDTNEDKIERLIEWNTDILARLVKNITARHKIMKPVNKPKKVKTESISGSSHGGEMVLDEVKEIIEMPDFDARNYRNQENPDLIELDLEVVSQLRDYVVAIALQYHNNPFHNFDHASHVGMSVAKLMSRIVGPDGVLGNQSSNASDGDLASYLHDRTYGITSDPLTQFACVYAALIHDVDHQGVPNTQLVKEKAPVAVHYKGKSIAEQNSVDIAWNLLMEPGYDALRNAICPTGQELLRFRKLVVNSVMATDIMDKDLKNLRNARWEKAFDEADIKEGARDNANRKATIVIEHLIQASDVAHTMQHWHVYRKWNERLFEEMYVAYKVGRAEKDPSDVWYQGELGFFDFYIIPLAKKLSDCGVFGVTSDEYLNYAQKNREEWEERGKEVVASMVAKLNTDAGSPKSWVSGSLKSGSVTE